MIYFTADTHFGSERTLKLSKRPFKSVKEMDNTIIENFNKILTPDDVLIHLGDFGDYERVQQINCPVYLIVGNYEMKEVDYLESFKDFQTMLYPYGFKKITRCYEIQTKFNGADVLLHCVHEPSKCLRHSEEIIDGQHINIFNLYGHIHGRQMIRHYGMDVGVDCHHFRPVSLDDIGFYFEAINVHYDHEVFDD